MLLSSYGTANRLRFYLKKGTVWENIIFSVDSTIFDTEFNHIILVINRITNLVLLYINTIKDTFEGDISTLPIDSSNAANISWGAIHDGTLPYEGLIDEMRIYSGLPTLEKIEFLHTYPSGIAIPTRIHHLRQQKVA